MHGYFDTRSRERNTTSGTPSSARQRARRRRSADAKSDDSRWWTNDSQRDARRGEGTAVVLTTTTSTRGRNVHVRHECNVRRRTTFLLYRKLCGGCWFGSSARLFCTPANTENMSSAPVYSTVHATDVCCTPGEKLSGPVTVVSYR